MSHKLTKRHIRAIKKSFENKELRTQRQEQRRVAQVERSLPARRVPRRRDWEGDDEYASREAMRAQRRDIKLAPAAVPEGAPIAVGTVMEIRSADSLVSIGDRTIRALLPLNARAAEEATRSPLAVGDRVELTPVDSETARIVAVLPRHSALMREVHDPSRRNAHGKDQAIAANIDQVIVACSPQQPPFRPGLIDRYLVAASRDELTTLICLNKIDLGIPPNVEELLAGYERLGVRVVRASAASGAGVDELRQCLAGCVSLLTGHSGVGKSSLLNALESGLALRVGDVTQATAGQGKGRHTTSSARLIPLATPDTYVVDSPGIRSYGVAGMARTELSGHFHDIAALAIDCSFRDCLHKNERGCAVATGAEGDAFLRRRLASYRSVLSELQ